MKKIILSLFLILFSLPTYAEPNSVLGGKLINSDHAHYVSIGWPGLTYEYWTSKGHMDWAIGAELVYGDWSANYSDVDIGFALNVPFKWHLRQSDNIDVGLKLVPGGLVGDANDNFVGAIRGEFGIPITIGVNDTVNVLTGATVPFTVVFPDSVDPYVIIPIMPRFGLEAAVDTRESVTPSLIVEMGPTIAIGDFGTDVDFGIRASIGCLFF